MCIALYSAIARNEKAKTGHMLKAKLKEHWKVIVEYGYSCVERKDSQVTEELRIRDRNIGEKNY